MEASLAAAPHLVEGDLLEREMEGARERGRERESGRESSPQCLRKIQEKKLLFLLQADLNADIYPNASHVLVKKSFLYDNIFFLFNHSLII